MKRYILLLGILAIMFVLSLIRSYALEPNPNKETFEDIQLECPVSAVRQPDGTIKVEPGHHTFNTLPDYTDFLTKLFNRGAKCIPPMVANNREPVAGILGGLGNGQQPPSAFNNEGTTRDVFSSNFHGEDTSAKTPIDKLDDYEYTRVYQQERGARNDLEAQSKTEKMKWRSLDWSNLPFNSETRANQEDTFVAGRMDSGFREPESGVFFRNMQGAHVEPPDVQAQKDREEKLLAAYRPTGVSKHKIDSQTKQVARLVHDLYEKDPNWEPVVTKTGDNKWEITELRPKPREERWEDAQAKAISLSKAEEAGKSIPPPSININDRMRGDPYFAKGGLGDSDNNRFWNYNDFNKWTPGLERMFAPTMSNNKWY
jgi:hypothetical protein